MKRKICFICATFGVIALFALGIWGQRMLMARRPVKTAQLTDSALAALGGLRALGAEVVWFRAGRLQREGKYVELAQLSSTLTDLDPYDPEVWQYAAWNLAYNVAMMMPTYADRWRWVEAGIRLLRDKGLAVNPTEPGIYRELAWLFELKMGTNLDPAHDYYRGKWREKVSRIRARAAAEPAEAAAIWAEIGMRPEKMAEIARREGIEDWTEPLASAIYWAACGIPHATDETERTFLEGIVKQSKNLLAKQRNKVP
ncbi:MAG: hypothetical protein ACI4R9_06640 [Kiritimatiellia bacterium]